MYVRWKGRIAYMVKILRKRWIFCRALALTAICVVCLAASPDLGGETPAVICRAAASPALTDARQTAAYWLERHPEGERLLLDEKGIAALNEEMRRKTRTLTALSSAPAVYSGDEVRHRISAVQAIGDFATGAVPELYAGGAVLTQAAYEAARENCALTAVPERVGVRYGVVVRRADLRLLPVADGWFETPSDVHYDALQATAVDPAEPALVLTGSADGRFFFCILRHYSGWLAAEALAFTDRVTWEQYAAPADFAVVTAPALTLQAARAQRYQMGARIPLSNEGMLLLPVRTTAGQLQVCPRPASFGGDLHHGYLPCTENQFVRQGFRFLGAPYGWGGLEGSVDCSAFTGDVYRSMGIELPRDADVQGEVLPYRADLEGSAEDRCALLRQFPVGTLLTTPTHVLMYLGTDDAGVPCVLQAMSSYFTFDGGARQKHYLRRVIASTVLFPSFAGTPYIESVQSFGAVCGK